MATVIRIIKYEGTEEAVQKAIAQSLPLGQKLCTSYTITVAEHQNDLPPLLTLEEQRVADLFRGIAPVREMEIDQDQLGPFGRHMASLNITGSREAFVRFTSCNCNIPGYENLPCPRHPGKL